MGNIARIGLFGCVIGTLLLAPAAWAQSPVHEWSQRFGNTGDDIGYGIATDGNGNVFVTGLFHGFVNFGGAPLVSFGNSADIFVAKYGPNGNHLWSQRFGDIGIDRGYGIAVDGTGNTLVTGEFTGTVDFGGGALASAGCDDIFVAKYNGAGGHRSVRKLDRTSTQPLTKRLIHH